MAGSYPDAPGRRMAWDADGSILWNFRADGAYNQTGTVTEFTGSQPAELNDEDITAVNLNQGGNTHEVFGLIFPELREVDGVFVSQGSGYPESVDAMESSVDTTNGVGGTWVQEIANVDASPLNLEAHRNNITSLALVEKRAVRFKKDANSTNTFTLVSLHVYGVISPGETPDRLLWIDEATGLEFTAPLDLGDVPRGGSADHELRLRNNSASLTINNIQYTAEALFLTAGDWWTFTLPGGATFQATRQVASLAPSTSTGVITARRIIPATQTLGLHTARFRATHGSLS